MTNIAILCLSKDSTIESNIIAKLVAVQNAKVFVYSKNRYESGDHGLVENIEIPEEYDTISKMHNFVVRDQHNKGFTGTLHVIEDAIAIEKDPSKFIDELHNMMAAINMNVWFNTVCDGMNYVYSKYNPRIVIEFDDPKWQVLGINSIVFTSHYNAAWIAYNMANYSDTEYLFDEQFSIRMFMIIEFLARRKELNKKENSLCLMNMYPTVKSENGTFKVALAYNENISDDITQAENEKFTAMNLDITPDNLIDAVLETLYRIINNKIQKDGK